MDSYKTKALPNLISYLAPVAEHYLTLRKVNLTKRYNYAARGFINLPTIEVDQHGSKCKQGESWLYFAVPAVASLTSLTPEDRLYIGAQTQDRMFRGDGLDGQNYHHAEMRSGNGQDNLIDFLLSGQHVVVYRIPAQRIADLISDEQSLNTLQILSVQPKTSKKHLGWWFEQYILFSEPKQWRWNSASSDKLVTKLFT